MSQSADVQRLLRQCGFTSHSEVSIYQPIDSHGTAVIDVEYYRQQSRITQTVWTPFGDVQLTEEHGQQPTENVWLFDGGMRGEGNHNYAVRILLTQLEGATMAYVQVISSHEGLEPETSQDITIVNPL